MNRRVHVPFAGPLDVPIASSSNLVLPLVSASSAPITAGTYSSSPRSLV
jgi:hypothetical protein